MTLSELNQLRDIRSEIREDRERIYRLKVWATATVGTLGASHGSGPTDKIGDAVALIAETEERYKNHIAELIEVEKRIIDYINGIPDPHVRRIFKYRFIDGRSWRSTARLLGGLNTWKTVSNTVYRYLES